MHADPRKLLAHGLPVVRVAVETYLIDFESSAVVFVVEFAQLDVALLAGRQTVGGEIKEDDVVGEICKAPLVAVDVVEP